MSLESETAILPSTAIAASHETQSKRRLEWHGYRSTLWPALLGAVSAAMVVAVVAGYSWGWNVANGSTNSSTITNAWGTALDIVALLFGLMVSVGLPVLWTRTKGYAKTLEVIGFEAVVLVLALLISGYVLFHGSGSGSGPSGILPGGDCGGTGQMCIYNH